MQKLATRRKVAPLLGLRNYGFYHGNKYGNTNWKSPHFAAILSQRASMPRLALARTRDLCELSGKAILRDDQESGFPYLHDFGLHGLPPHLPLMRACSFPASVLGPVDNPPWNLQRPFA